jgi:hypothetical protein
MAPPRRSRTILDVLARRHDREPKSCGGLGHPPVVGDERIELVGHLERRGEVDGVERPQGQRLQEGSSCPNRLGGLDHCELRDDPSRVRNQLGDRLSCCTNHLDLDDRARELDRVALEELAERSALGLLDTSLTSADEST